MRQPRIKVEASEGEAVYHCLSRTVNGELLFDDTAKEILRRQLWVVAEYCGVEILTYAILGNHFHILVRVPQRRTLTDQELLRRYKLLHPKPTPYQTVRLAVVCTQLETDGPEAVVWRRQQRALMGDVSPFMKLFKQRFSIWFNKSHRRFGTLWSERFKSVLVEPQGQAVLTMAAYIDLNSIRAGLATDPKDYRFCGYAEAVAGQVRARQGIAAVLGIANWQEAQASYRQLLFGTGTELREHKASIALEDFQRVVAEGGRLPLAVVLRCRLRHFSDGAILGSRAYLAAHFPAGLRQGKPVAGHPLPPLADWGDLVTLRGLRRKTIG